jgi:hypothetical protein
MVTLTIPAGTRIESGGTPHSTGGKLNVNGTAEKPVIMTLYLINLLVTGVD